MSRSLPLYTNGFVKRSSNPNALGVAPPGKELVGIVSAPLLTVTASGPMLLSKVGLSDPGGLSEVLSWMLYIVQILSLNGQEEKPPWSRYVSPVIGLPIGIPSNSEAA